LTAYTSHISEKAFLRWVHRECSLNSATDVATKIFESFNARECANYFWRCRKRIKKTTGCAAQHRASQAFASVVWRFHEAIECFFLAFWRYGS
jgi:hypothetical protein